MVLKRGTPQNGALFPCGFPFNHPQKGYPRVSKRYDWAGQGFHYSFGKEVRHHPAAIRVGIATQVVAFILEIVAKPPCRISDASLLQREKESTLVPFRFLHPFSTPPLFIDQILMEKVYKMKERDKY